MRFSVGDTAWLAKEISDLPCEEHPGAFFGTHGTEVKILEASKKWNHYTVQSGNRQPFKVESRELLEFKPFTFNYTTVDELLRYRCLF